MRISQFIFLFFFLFLLFPSRSAAWVKGVQTFPSGHATIVLHMFCLDKGTWNIDGYAEPRCDMLTQERWQIRIKNAFEQWNNAGSYFFFDSRPASLNDDPCNPEYGHIYFVLADYTQPHPCKPNRRFESAWGTYWPNAAGGAWVFLNTTAVPKDPPKERKLIISGVAQSTFLHELGHAIGLGHVYDQEGYAVMGDQLSRGYYDFLFADDIAGIRAIYGTQPGAQPVEQAARVPTEIGALEAPTPALGGASLGGHSDALQSDLSTIWGWACDADEVLVAVSVYVDWRRGDTSYVDRFLFTSYPALLGMDRADTLDQCGDIANGFGLVFDWNPLRPRQPYVRPDWIPDNTRLHRVEFLVTVYVDGVDIGSSNVEVVS